MGSAMPKPPSFPSAPDPRWRAICECLQRCARGLTDRAEDADDLVQQTIAALLARRCDLALHAGYARRALVRVWLDQQRALRRRLVRLARVAAALRRHHCDADQIEQAEQMERVRDAIRCLPTRQRAVIVLRLIEELDYDEIAEVLGISRPNVRSTLHAARARIRRALGERP